MITGLAGWLGAKLITSVGIVPKSGVIIMVVLLAAGAGMVGTIGTLLWVNAGLRGDITEANKATTKASTKAAQCNAEYGAHLQDDRNALAEAKRTREAIEAAGRAEAERIAKQSQEVRDALQRENDRLRRDLSAGAVRVRNALCQNPAAPSSSPGVPGAGASAGAPGPPGAPSGADLVAESVGAGYRKDALYDELYAIAVGDRKTCGLRGAVTAR